MPVGMLLEMAADAYGERVALGGKGDGITYRQLQRASAGGAGIILGRGARAVVFVGVNGPVFPLLVFAAAEAGVAFTPLNYRLSRDALAELVGGLDDPLVVCDDAFFDVVSSFAPTARRSEQWFPDAMAAVAVPGPDVDDDSAAVVLFTSGTTSKPKGVLLSHHNLVSYVLQTSELASAGAADAAIISVPPYHIAGVGTVLTNIYSGRRLVYLANFTASGWLGLVRTEGITNAMVVPTMLARIVEELAGRPAQVPTLRTLAYGGARMPRPVLEAALVAFPDVDFVNAYGLTETSSTIAVLGPQEHRLAMASADPALSKRLSSVGRLVPGMEGEIRGEGQSVCQPFEVGDLWVRGPQVSGRYVGHDSILDEEGWFPTKDRAWVDEEGYLFIEGRSDDTIIRGGENIAPAEIEDALRLHPAVSDAAVFGHPDDEWGERIIAFVVLHPTIQVDPDSLRQFTRAHLRGSRTPDEIVLVDELPYTPTGKLLRNQLRAGFAEQVGLYTAGRS